MKPSPRIVRNRRPVLMFATLLFATLPGGAGGDTLESWHDRLADGAAPAAVAQAFPESLLQDTRTLNGLRLRLKAEGRADLAQSLFTALAERQPSEAVLLNLSLAYVDQLMGNNLLRQGYLSSRSQDAVERIIDTDPEHWAAWYIRGLNNLYWPDWFRKAPLAREYLSEAVAIHQRRSPSEQGGDDKYALAYLALGDAHALLNQPAEARRVWSEGRRYYPYVPALVERLELPEDQLHEAVRRQRDADRPIDTDLAFLWGRQSAPFELVLTGGALFGPGPLDDQALRPGRLTHLELAGALTGFIPAFNNGPEAPNLPGEILQGKVVDGLLSDGAPANEYVDVGYVQLMNGKFELFLAAVQDGPQQGRVNFFLDRGWHWVIFDDIGIDPGFPVGVVKFWDFVFSTSPRQLPYSRQTESGAPAGVDRAGSLASGAVAPGSLGDADFDGRLDGTFNAIGRFPFDSVILPGAPFAQTRHFVTDIPVSPGQAALLTLANALAHLRLALDLRAGQPDLAATLGLTFHERLALARRHGQRAGLPASTRRIIERLDTNADEAALCEGWALLQQAAPTEGLYGRDFDGSGIERICTL